MAKKAFYSTMFIAIFAMIFVTGAYAGIGISPTTMNLKVGETATLTVTPDTLTTGYGIKSLNRSIATVNPPDGVGTASFTVTAVAPGTTKIQVLRLISGSYVAVASCTVTVTEAQTEVWPESATLKPVRLTLKVGEQASVDATVRPDNYNQGSLKWSIDDERTANVTANGLSATVDAVAAGTTTLRFTVGNVSASCTVIVTEAGELKTIDIVPASIELYAGDRCKFRVKTTPENAALPALSWEVTEGTSVAKILRTESGNCYIDALRPGQAVLTVTAGNLKAKAKIFVK